MRRRRRFAIVVALGISVTIACESEMDMAERVKNEMEPQFDHADHDPETVRSLVLSEADFLARPRDVAVIGDHVVVSDMLSDPVLHVFDRNSFEHVGSFGGRGQGPGEFVSYAVLSDIPGSADLVYALDPTSRLVTRFRLPDGSIVPFGATDALAVPTQNFVYDLKMIDERRAVGLGFFQTGRLGLFDLDAQRTRFAGLTPGKPDEPFVIGQQAYHSYVSLDPARARLALVTRLTTDVDLYSVTGEHLARAETPFTFPVDYMQDEGGNFMPGWYNRHGYQGVTASGERVYALFSGRAEAHYRGMRGSHAEFVHIFDWNGRLEHVLRLDREVLKIALDPKESMLYAITERPQPAVLVFSVPQSLRPRGHE